MHKCLIFPLPQSPFLMVVYWFVFGDIFPVDLAAFAFHKLQQPCFNTVRMQMIFFVFAPVVLLAHQIFSVYETFKNEKYCYNHFPWYFPVWVRNDLLINPTFWNGIQFMYGLMMLTHWICCFPDTYLLPANHDFFRQDFLSISTKNDEFLRFRIQCIWFTKSIRIFFF